MNIPVHRPKSIYIKAMKLHILNHTMVILTQYTFHKIPS